MCSSDLFRLMSADAPDTAESGGGLRHRMIASSEQACSYEQFISLIKTKKYTDARLRRAIIYSMCSTLDSDLHTEPKYTTLLAANKEGLAMLSSVKKSMTIPLVSNPSMLASLPTEAERARVLCRRAEALRAMCCEGILPSDSSLRTPPRIVN